MKMMPVHILLIMMLLLAPATFRLYSQDNGNEVSSSHIRSIIDQAYGADPRLVSGKVYRGARQGSVAGHPYYFDENWKTGYVIIDSIRFDSLLLKYDVLENKLVLNTSNISSSYFLLCINMEKTDRFSIDGHDFIPFHREKDEGDRRFCEAVVEGDISYLILKTKKLKVEGGVVDFSYKTYDNQFLLYNNELTRLRGRRTLFRLFPDLINNLKQFIRQENLIQLRKSPENMTRLIEYCNPLLNNS